MCGHGGEISEEEVEAAIGKMKLARLLDPVLVWWQICCQAAGEDRNELDD